MHCLFRYTDACNYVSIKKGVAVCIWWQHKFPVLISAQTNKRQKHDILNRIRIRDDTDLLPRISCWLRDIEAFRFGALEAVCQFCWAWLCGRPSCVLIQLNICLPQSSGANVICKCSKRLKTLGGTAVNEKLAAGTLNENQSTVSPKSAH